MSELPSLTRNDLATALFGVGTRIGWLKEQRPRCKFWRDQIAICKEVERKLNIILGSMDPPQQYEDELIDLGDGDEPVYGPTAEAKRLLSEAQSMAEAVRRRSSTRARLP